MFSKHAKRPTRTVARDSSCDNTRLKKGNDEESEFFYFFITVIILVFQLYCTYRTVRQLFSKYIPCDHVMKYTYIISEEKIFWRKSFGARKSINSSLPKIGP